MNCFHCFQDSYHFSARKHYLLSAPLCLSGVCLQERSPCHSRSFWGHRRDQASHMGSAPSYLAGCFLSHFKNIGNGEISFSFHWLSKITSNAFRVFIKDHFVRGLRTMGQCHATTRISLRSSWRPFRAFTQNRPGFTAGGGEKNPKTT